jgi:predicted O-methyltransferase YrrM
MLAGSLRRLREAPGALGLLSTLARRGALDIDGIPTHMTRAERYRLYRLAQESAGPVLEVGSYLGASAACLAMGIADRPALEGRSDRLYCVDTWMNDAMSEGNRDTLAEFRSNVSRFSDSIVVLQGRSVDVARGFGQRLGLLFIDGDHSYEGVSADIDAWLPHLRPGGVVAFHDVGWAEGVQRALRERVLPGARRHARMTNLAWAWV